MKNLMIIFIAIAGVFVSANPETPNRLPIGSELELKLYAIDQIHMVYGQVRDRGQKLKDAEPRQFQETILTDAKVSEVLEHVANFRPTITYFGDVDDTEIGFDFYCGDQRGAPLFFATPSYLLGDSGVLKVLFELASSVMIYVGEQAKEVVYRDKSGDQERHPVHGGYLYFPKAQAGLVEVALHDETGQTLAYYGSDGDQFDKHVVEDIGFAASFDGVYPVRFDIGEDLIVLDGAKASTGDWIALEISSAEPEKSGYVQVMYPDGSRPDQIWLSFKQEAGSADKMFREVEPGSGTFHVWTSPGIQTWGYIANYVPSGSNLAVSLGAGSPKSTNVVAGNTKVHVGQFQFSAQNMDYEIDSLKIRVSADAANSVEGVGLRYIDNGESSHWVYQALQDDTAVFTNLGMYVRRDDTSNLEVFVRLADFHNNGDSGDLVQVSLLHDDGFVARNYEGRAFYRVGHSDIQAEGQFRIFKSLPTLSQISPSVSFPSTGVTLFRFQVSADQADTIEWKKITFKVHQEGVDVKDFSLYEQGESARINAIPAQINQHGYMSLYVGSVDDHMVESIPAGGARIYELRGTVTGWGDEGDSFVIKIADDNVLDEQGSFLDVENQGARFIWSDRSDHSHTVESNDWTNGYLIENFPWTFQVYEEL